MGTTTYLIIYFCSLISILICRVLPTFILEGRKLPKHVEEAFSLIPVSAFAALVIYDLFQPSAIAEDPLEGLLPAVAAIPVIVVARKTKSLIWCVVVGMAGYAFLFYLLV
jgi:branched-subunit amino acid transport protein